MHIVETGHPVEVGWSLDWSPYGQGPWLVVSFHDTLADAKAAYADQLNRCGVDKDPDHYRISGGPDA